MVGGQFMRFKKLFILGVLCTSIMIGSVTGVHALSTTYTVQKGDTYWIISQKLNVPIASLMAANNATQSTVIYIGQRIKIPTSTEPYITYKYYTVQKGDILWNIAIKFGIPLSELLKANNLSTSSWANIGDVLKIPVHNVPIKNTPRPQYGEALDWWTEAQYVIPIGANFEVQDFTTGKSFFARRTTGANHADCETLTAADTNKMKGIWGGSFSWIKRPVLIKYNGRKIAASMSGMPHAGNDSGAGGVWTSWRSGSYGAGTNFDWIKNNGMNGHFDIHFLNSTKHADGELDANHQANIKISAGLK